MELLNAQRAARDLVEVRDISVTDPSLEPVEASFFVLDEPLVLGAVVRVECADEASVGVERR